MVWLYVELSEVGLFGDVQTVCILRILVDKFQLGGWLLESLEVLDRWKWCLVRNQGCQLACSFLGNKDLLKHIFNLLSSLLKAHDFALVAPEEELHIKSINILQQVLVHHSLGLAKSHESQVRVPAFELVPVGILIATGLLRIQHFVLLEFHQQLLSLVEQCSAKQLASTGRLHDFVDIELLFAQPSLTMIIETQVPVVPVSALSATAEQAGQDLFRSQAESPAIEEHGEQVFDVLLVNLLPADDVGAESLLPHGIEPLPDLRDPLA